MIDAAVLGGVGIDLYPLIGAQLACSEAMPHVEELEAALV